MTETYYVTIEPVGREVECRADQTILDACLRSGVWLPHSCTHGTCATCKVELVDGEVDHGEASSFALMDFERDDGKTLACCAKPLADVVIEADIDVDEDMEVYPVDDYTGKIVEVTEIANDTRRVVIELDKEIAFNAGQYMRIMVPGSTVDRTYSMANPPTETKRLEFQIRRVAGGACTDGWVFNTIAEGEEVKLSGPYGRFVLRLSDNRPAVLIAGGTGLAPIASMIKHALVNDQYDGHLTLYQGARTQEWMYDVALFQELARDFPDRFTYRPCLSEEEAEGFATGLVTDVLDADHETLKGHAGYVCGPPMMVEASLKALMGKRLFPRDIYREDFFNESDKASGGVRSPLIKR